MFIRKLEISFYHNFVVGNRIRLVFAPKNAIFIVNINGVENPIFKKSRFTGLLHRTLRFPSSSNRFSILYTVLAETTCPDFAVALYNVITTVWLSHSEKHELMALRSYRPPYASTRIRIVLGPVTRRKRI